MIIYNVTTKIALTHEEAWLHWMQHEHIPAVLATGCFIESRLLHLFENDDEEGATYATQYMARSLDDYQRYIDEYSAALRQQSINQWGAHAISFRTIMRQLGSFVEK